MSINVWTDPMQHAELFGKPVLFTNWLILRIWFQGLALL